MTVPSGAEVEWPSHTLLVRREEDLRQAGVGAWVHRGLTRGERILYSRVTGDTTVVPDLRRGGVDVQRAVRDGQLMFVPAEEFFPGVQQATLVKRALEEGYPGVRLSAQANAAIEDVGAKQYEVIDHLMEELCASLPVLVLCQYDARGSAAKAHGSDLAAVVDSHLDAIRVGQMLLHRRGDEVLLGGEVDFVSADVLSHALRAICQPEHLSDLVLDLTGLVFIDVAGCRAVAVGTEPLRGRGGRAVLRGVEGHHRKVMTLLGIDRLPGLELV